METAYQRVEKRMRIVVRALDGLEGAAVRSQRAEEVFLLAKQKTEKKQEEYDEAVAKLEEAKKKLETAFLATMEGSGRGKGRSKGKGSRGKGKGSQGKGKGDCEAEDDEASSSTDEARFVLYLLYDDECISYSTLDLIFFHIILL